jgi:O-Antigen ligase
MVCAIGRTLRTLSGETAAGIVVAVTVFCVVLGSSSDPELVGPGKKLRWVGLCVLVGVSLVLAARDRRTPISGLLLWALALGAWLEALGLVSTAWSADPRLTFERAASFALLLTAAGALAFAARSRPALPSSLLFGVLAGTVAAALAGVAMLAVAHGDAVQAASTLYPARYRGLGENPDTMAMLEGLVAPVALWALLRAKTRGGQAFALGSLVLFLTSISASGSRGGLIAAFVGGIVLSATLSASWRQRLVLALSVCVAVAGAAGGTQIPKPLVVQPVTGSGNGGKTVNPTLPLVGASVGGPEQGYTGRLEDELFRVFAGSRSFLSSSGRLQAWYEAIRQGDSRPLLGFGFGTENVVYLDRVYNFQGDYVENSLIGFYLQLGVIGVLVLVGLLVSVCNGVVLAVRRGGAGAPGPALAGVVAAGLALVFVQSYVYSVGNVATVAFWTASFVGVAAVSAPARRPLASTESAEVEHVALG